MKLCICMMGALLCLGAAGVRADEPGAPRSSLLHDNGGFVTGGNAGVCEEFASAISNTSSPTGLNETLGAPSFYLQNRMIDDFIVPPGESWTLSAIIWRAYEDGTLYDATIDDARIRIWAKTPTPSGQPVWGDMFTNRAGNSFFTGAMRTPNFDPSDCNLAIKSVEISMTGLPPLPPGKYWIEVGFDSAISTGLYSPPTEPRQGTDNALQTDFSGSVTPILDEATGARLEFPFQVYGTVAPETPHACVLPNGTCTNTTRNNCEETLGGRYSVFYVCSQLGACCNQATGQCIEHVEPTDCQAAGMQFAQGQSCSAIPGCGLINGACCFPNDTPVDCQSFTRGINCANAGGRWHPGSCSVVLCNDYCETPAPLFNGDTPFDNFSYGAERATTPNGCGNDPFVGMHDLWYRYVSTLSTAGGIIEISLCQNTAFPATLQVYHADANFSCVDLNGTALAAYCDVGGCGNGGPGILRIPAGPGDVFVVRIGGYDGAQGGGTTRVTPIESGFGACCKLDGACALMSEAACTSGPNLFTPGVTCDLAANLCGPKGACCRGPDGCQFTYSGVCAALGGQFLGVASMCGAPADCDGDGETDFCALALGAADCNQNGLPDSCDVGVLATSTDCDANGVPDECQPALYCCRGDANHDSRVDGADISNFVEWMVSRPPSCFTPEFCRVDMNEDFALDQEDVVLFADALLDGALCPIVLHSSARVSFPLPGSPGTRKVFMFRETGELIGNYDAVEGAQSDSFGYRDGTTDGYYVYFGWTQGVARHDPDGSNGVQIIFGPTPGTAVTWRALAFDPSGDNGNGSLWTQSFTSDLVESTMAGQLLHQFPNDLTLYGLTYDYQTGMLWGHNQSSVDASAEVVEIDPSNGQPTGVKFPSHFNLPGGSVNGVALHGGLEMDPQSGLMFGCLQGSNDALFSANRNGELEGALTPNPRADLTDQTGSTSHLGVTPSRP